GAQPTRLKREAHLQRCGADAFSTCHDGLLAPVARASQRAVRCAVGPRETRPHSRGAVVSVECSSRTLPACWQLCRKCNDTPLWGAGQGCLPCSLCQDTCTQKFPEEVSDVSVGDSFLARF